jgi:hypothetical protein
MISFAIGCNCVHNAPGDDQTRDAENPQRANREQAHESGFWRTAGAKERWKGSLPDQGKNQPGSPTQARQTEHTRHQHRAESDQKLLEEQNVQKMAPTN